MNEIRGPRARERTSRDKRNLEEREKGKDPQETREKKKELIGHE
jgi:hypothetical protein